MRLKILLMGVAAGVAMAGSTVNPAMAWGSMGHRLIGEEGMRALPDYAPDFLRTEQAISDVGEYSREPDRWRDSGMVHDKDRDQAHDIDLDDSGNTLAGFPLDQLPATRADFELALAAKNVPQHSWGYLPYALVDGYQQVVKDLAFWRVLSFEETRESDRAKRAWFHADRLRREALTLRDIGVLSHYVGDATNPMHLSIHYNGWGDYPNPQGFTTDHVHHLLEGPYIHANISNADVRANLHPYAPCTGKIDQCFAARLKLSAALLVPEYQLQKDGGFADGDPRGKAFMAQQLGKGAADLRDVVLDAWRDSKTMGIGWPSTPYDDFVAGKVADPYTLLYGDD